MLISEIFQLKNAADKKTSSPTQVTWNQPEHLHGSLAELAISDPRAVLYHFC